MIIPIWGATWSDAVDGNGTLTGVGVVDDQVPGTYTLTFDYTDSNGNAAATVTRTVVVEDTSAPVITLIGDTNVTHEAGSDYTDLGATWSDAVDGNGTLTGVGVVDDQVPGTYTLTFDYTDSNGNAAATVTRTVVVEDTSAPVITLIGDTNVTHEAGSDYTDLGAIWNDAVDGNGTLTGVGVVDDQVPGTYTLTFDYTDGNGNAAATVTRTVVVEDTSAPVITLIGDTNVTHEAGSDYTDLGATWSDAVDGNGTLTGVGVVDDQVPGTYTLSFDYTDSNGNVAATVTRTVIVEDTSAPVITLIGDTNVTHEAGSDYTDLGAIWNDAVDGNGTLTGVGEVDDQVPGTYTPSFDYTDSNGNTAATVTRTVVVEDTSAPGDHSGRRHQCDPRSRK